MFFIIRNKLSEHRKRSPIGDTKSLYMLVIIHRVGITAKWRIYTIQCKGSEIMETNLIQFNLSLLEHIHYRSDNME